ncbi:S41 family peptidase [Planctomycetota bacterium]
MRSTFKICILLGFILILTVLPCFSTEAILTNKQPNFTSALSHTESLSKYQTIQNLRAFAKLYGYVKYFHPSDEASSIDWDKFAVYGAGQVKKARDSVELNKILESMFLPIAPSIQIYDENQNPRDYLKSLPKDTSDLKVVAWQHLGVRLNGWGGYKSLRLNSNTKLPSGWKGRVYQIIKSTDVDKFRGKEIKVKAAIRTNLKSSASWTSLSIIVFTKDGKRLEYLMDVPLKGITPWRVYELTCKAHENVRRIDIGVILSGMGQIWADEIEVTIVSEDNERQTVEVQNEGFEHAASKSTNALGWSIPAESWYGQKIDNKKPYRGKQSLLLEPLQSLFEDHPQVAETINKPLDSGLMCQIPLSLYSDEQGTLGHDDRYPFNVLSKQLEQIDPNTFSAEAEDVRLAGIIITWTVLQHFYPYFDVVNVNWDTELTTALQRALTDKNADQYYDTLYLFVAKLRDGHGFIRRQPGPSIPLMGLPSGTVLRNFPFAVDWIENQVVVIASKDPNNIRVGDIIVSVDGIDAEQKLLNIERYICGSPQLRRNDALKFFTVGNREKEATLMIKRGGKAVQVQMKPNRGRWVREERPEREGIEEILPSIFYVDLTRATMPEIEEQIHNLASAKGVIFDLRGYPNGNHRILGYLMRQEDTSDCWMQIPKTIYPDRERPIGYGCRGWNVESLKPKILGKVVFMTNVKAASYAESLMGFVEHYKLGQIVGQPTTGANGNTNSFWLPGKFRVSWTGMKVVKHDGSQHHLIGVLPTVPVQRTIQGVIDGRDEYLEKALEIITNQ